MLTTAYGLGLANLLYKPIISRLERRCRDHVTRLQVQVETIRMVQERVHPNLIRDYWDAWQGSRLATHTTPVAAAKAPLLHLVKASG
jgi:chemotaxis protein MotA